MPSDLDPGLLRQAEEAFRAGIAALGIRTGAAKGDVKVTPSGPRIGEIAARLSGGYMSGWTFPYASGVEVTAAALDIAVGLAPPDLRPAAWGCSAERAFISLPGTVDGMLGLREAAAVPAVRNVFVRTPTGLRDVTAAGDVDAAGLEVVFPVNNVQKCGNVLSQASTRAEAVGRAMEAIGRIFIRLRPDNPATTVFLLDDSPRVPDVSAFSLRSARARAALEALPARRGSGGALSYLPLDLSEEPVQTDWHGRDLAATLRLVSEITGVGPAERGHGMALGRRFWKALLVGGAQGGVYFVDSLRRRMRDGRAIDDLVGE